MIPSKIRLPKIAKGSKSFNFALGFLPKRYRAAISTLYSYCRFIDNLVDECELTSQEKIDYCEFHLSEFLHSHEVQIFLAKYNIPSSLFEELVNGIRSDLYPTEYKNFEQLYSYCYQVAGVVGQMLCYLFNTIDAKTLESAEKLGVAMQITNILRDLKEDYQMGRVYIPKEDLVRFQVLPEDFAAAEPNQNLRNLVSYYVDKAENYYVLGNTGIKNLPEDVQKGISIASLMYSSILDKISKNNFDSLSSRIYTTKMEKVFLVLKHTV